MLRIGFSGGVRPGLSVHGPTLLNAVAMALPLVESRWNIQIQPVWADDGATAEGGAAAARQLVEAGVAAVVGHYASAAAKAAIEVYQQHCIALYLPAASATQLTDAPRVYRLCDSDADYCAYLHQVLARAGHESVGVACDGSLHGASVVSTLKTLSSVFHDARADDAVMVFAGLYRNSVDFLASCGAQYPLAREVVFCDDTLTPMAKVELRHPRLSVTVVGFGHQPRTPQEQALAADYQLAHGTAPGVYFFETVRALEVAVSHLLQPDADPLTCAGVLRMPRDASLREARPLSFDVLRLAPLSEPETCR